MDLSWTASTIRACESCYYHRPPTAVQSMVSGNSTHRDVIMQKLTKNVFSVKVEHGSELESARQHRKVRVEVDV